MTDREKVIQGLTCHLRGSVICDCCPYQDEDTFGTKCIDRLRNDALQILDQPARILSYEEIEALPELAVVFEEVRVDWEKEVKYYPDLMPKDEAVDVSIAPVEKQGRKLCGSGINTDICPGMLDEYRGTQVRYWSARPSYEQRKAAPWA